MIRIAVLFAISGLGLAVLVPSYLLSPGTERAAPQGPQPAEAPSGEATQTSNDGALGTDYREASLEADPRGQYSADALINGVPVRFMVDTGASVVVLSASTARRVGIKAVPGAKWTVKTANGNTMASPVVVGHVGIGTLYMNDVKAVILAPEAGEVNLLGASFLKRLVSVEQRAGVLVLRQ
jgi:aspartyl protease family protein